MTRNNSSHKIIYVAAAMQDLREAKIWYRTQLPGLEKRFATSILQAINRMQINPYTYAVRYRNVRIIHPAIFPFGIHFYIIEDKKQIVITAIVHDYMDVQLKTD